jgi:hypothetical protein
MIFKKREKKRGTCFRLPPSIIDEIDKIAKANKVDRTTIIEAALVYFLEKYQGGKK